MIFISRSTLVRRGICSLGVPAQAPLHPASISTRLFVPAELPVPSFYLHLLCMSLHHLGMSWSCCWLARSPPVRPAVPPAICVCLLGVFSQRWSWQGDARSWTWCECVPWWDLTKWKEWSIPNIARMRVWCVWCSNDIPGWPFWGVWCCNVCRYLAHTQMYRCGPLFLWGYSLIGVCIFQWYDRFTTQNQ